MIDREYVEKQLSSVREQANRFLASYNQAIGAISVLEHLLSQSLASKEPETSLTENDLKEALGAAEVEVVSADKPTHRD